MYFFLNTEVTLLQIKLFCDCLSVMMTGAAQPVTNVEPGLRMGQWVNPALCWFLTVITKYWTKEHEHIRNTSCRKITALTPWHNAYSLPAFWRAHSEMLYTVRDEHQRAVPRPIRRRVSRRCADVIFVLLKDSASLCHSEGGVRLLLTCCCVTIRVIKYRQMKASACPGGGTDHPKPTGSVCVK